MRYSMRCFFLVGLLGTTGASGGVSVDYARQADFSQYRTFTWVDGTAAEDPRVEKWIREAVTRELRADGLQMLAEGGDLLVRTHLTLREEHRMEVDIIGERVVGQDSVTKVTPGENMREVGVGTVAVDLLDGYSKLQVWQGVVGAVTRPEIGKKTQKRIDKSIGRVFRRYPPE